MPNRRRRFAAELRAPFRLVFHRSSPQDPDPDPEAPLRIPEVEFIAYAEDCTLSGRIGLSEERLSDLLNQHESFQLVDVLVTPLDGSLAIELHDLLITRDELFLVQATGPRGNAARRQRTRQHPIVVKAAPYEVHGFVHTIPGSDPIASFRRRRPMVAVSDAVVRFSLAGQSQERRAGTVIINRDLIDWIAEGQDEALASLDMPAEAAGPLAKDFTGNLLLG
ncbi:MAG: hypothetical protein H0V73_01815 [Chloroflexi bacterium]|nr:hypothetical protein [Chloroflexota bacterium]